MTLSSSLAKGIETTPESARHIPLGALFIPLLAMLVMGGLMLPVFIAEARETWDHGYYTDYVLAWSLNGQPPTFHTHVGYPFTLLVLHQATRLPIWIAGVILNTAAQMLTAYFIYAYLLPAIPLNRERRRAIAAMLALALCLVSAISFLTLPDYNVYYGYVIPSVYHNPTSVLLKPLALAQMLLIVSALSRPGGARWRLPLLLFLSIAGVVIKPSFAVCMIAPSLLALLWQLWRRNPFDWLTLVFGFALPTLLMLALQSDLLGTLHGGAYFAPLESLRLNDDNYATRMLFSKQFLSIAFPLLVVAAHPRAALRSLPLMLAWMAYTAGLAQMLLLNEPLYPKAGNFWWGAQITLFILFVVSARFMLEQSGGRMPRFSFRRTPLLSAAGCAMLLHTAAGAFWYGIHALAVFSHPLDWRLWW